MSDSSNLASILGYLFPSTIPGKDWDVSRKGDTTYISKWNISDVIQPTEDSVMSHEQEWLAWKASQEIALSKEIETAKQWLILNNLSARALKQVLENS